MTASKTAQTGTLIDRTTFQASMARFASKANHDFREPLAMLKFMIQHLRSSADPAEHEKLFAAADESISHLQRYTQQLIDYAWLQSGPTDLQFAEVEISRIVAEVVEDLRKIHPSADVTFEHTQMPQTAIVDTKVLRMALSAVIDNAIVHAGSSEISVEVQTAELGRVEICVTDHGPGIPASDVPQIKLPFAQAKRQDVVDATYFGLGLTIADSACATLGGKLIIDEEVKDGARVLLQLPARE